jgi:hypothetical protein
MTDADRLNGHRLSDDHHPRRDWASALATAESAAPVGVAQTGDPQSRFVCHRRIAGERRLGIRAEACVTIISPASLEGSSAGFEGVIRSGAGNVGGQRRRYKRLRIFGQRYVRSLPSRATIRGDIGRIRRSSVASAAQRDATAVGMARASAGILGGAGLTPDPRLLVTYSTHFLGLYSSENFGFF